MIRSTTALLAFIIFLSTVYYISFWGAFDINVFQYLAATDIIKGIAYPLRHGVMLSVIFIVYVCVTTIVLIGKAFKSEKYSNQEEIKIKRQRIISNALILVISLILFIAYPGNVWTGYVLSAMSFFMIVNVIGFIDILFNPSKTLPAKEIEVLREDFLTGLAKSFELPFIMLLLVNAIISGQVEAHGIKSLSSFDYVYANDFPSGVIKAKERYLILLGSAGDKYFFVNNNISEHFIIDKAAMPVLKSFHYDKSLPQLPPKRHKPQSR